MLTSNPKLAAAPGNVSLRKGEANLPKSSVVNVSQLLTIDKSDMTQKIGQVTERRIQEIVAGLGVLLQPRKP